MREELKKDEFIINGYYYFGDNWICYKCFMGGIENVILN